MIEDTVPQPLHPPEPRVESPLALGNRALRDGDNTIAISHYLRALRDMPALSKVILGNLAMARQKHRALRATDERLRVAVCGCDFARTGSGRADTLSTLYATFADVKIIDGLFPSVASEVAAHVRNTKIPLQTFVIEDESRFIDQMLELVVAHPYDVVHLSKPRASNIFFGILYKQIWDARVFFDIDEEEPALATAESSVNIDEPLTGSGNLPSLSELPGVEWTRIAYDLAREFDGLTVATAALRGKYGGEIITDLEHKNRLQHFVNSNAISHSLTPTLLRLGAKILGSNIAPLFAHSESFGSDDSSSLAATMPAKTRISSGILGGIDANVLSSMGRLFDSVFYVSTNPNIDLIGKSAFEHFCIHGWRERRDPNPLFAIERYFALHPDVLNADINPLLHYVVRGGGEGDDIGGIFDSVFYMRSNPTVRERGMNPLEHFVFEGLGDNYFPSYGVDPKSFLSPLEAKLSPWKRVALLLDRVKKFVEAVEPVVVPDFAAPQLSIIVYALNNATAVACCIASLLRSPPTVPYEILIADDGSHDLLPQLAQRWRGVKYIPTVNSVGFASTLNRAAELAAGDFILFLDGNCDVTPTWQAELRSALASDPNIAVVGGKILDASGNLQHGGGLAWRDGSLTIRGTGADAGHPHFNYSRIVDFVIPAFMIVRTEMLLRVGGFDPNYSTQCYVAADLGMKFYKRGWKVVYQPMARANRFATEQGIDGQLGDHQLFRQKWHRELQVLPNWSKEVGSDQRGIVGHILCIDQSTPNPDKDAGSLRQFSTFEILLKLGWAVSFVPELTMDNTPVYTENLQRLGVQCIHKPYFGSLYEYVVKSGATIDLAFLYKGPAALHYLNIIERYCPNARFVVETCDIHYIREYREAELAGSLEKMQIANKTKCAELEVMRRTDCTIVLSEYEKRELQNEIPQVRIAITSLIQQCPGRQCSLSELRDICFVGGYLHQPNCDAVHYFVETIWPLVRLLLPEVNFRIIGSHVPPHIKALEGGGVIVDGFVPEMATSLGRCRISVAPLRYGAGIKGKIGSSLSLGIPCVATTLAAEGMGLGLSDGVDVADDPHDFADRVVRLYTDTEYWEKMSAGGLKFVNREYSFEAASSRISTILRDLGLPVGRPARNRIDLQLVRADRKAITGPPRKNSARRAEVAVVIPLYNHEKYIVAALESVFTQTMPPAEVIVIDDGSSDRSAEIAACLCAGYEGAVVWRQTNKGAHNTINAAIQRTTQPLVAILNSDDVFLPHRLERSIEAMRSSRATIFASALSFIDQGGEPIPNSWYDKAVEYWHRIGNTSIALLNANFLMTTSNLVLHRDVFKDIGFFRDFRYAHDLDFFIRALAGGHRIQRVPEVLLKYRYHPNNTISENHTKVRAEWACVCAEAMLNPSEFLYAGMSPSTYQQALTKVVITHGLANGVQRILLANQQDGAQAPDFARLIRRREVRDSLYRSLE